MKRKIILSIAIGLGMVGMMVSCGGNKSRLEGVNPSEVTADTAQPAAAVEAPASDSSAAAPTAETLTPDTEAATDTAKKTSNNGELNIKITPGKMKTKHYEYAEGWKASMTITVANLSGTPVSASDYTIAYKCRESNGYTDDSERTYTSNLTHKGIDLGPNETKKITISRGEAYKFYDFKVKPKKK